MPQTGLKPRGFSKEGFPNWEKPIPVGSFSVNSDRSYEKGHGNLRYFRNPEKLPLDLNLGIELAKRKPNNPMDEGIDNLITFIMENYEDMLKNREIIPNKKHLLFPFEFVGWRGLLRLIMCTPFEYQQNWIINVTHYKGTYYLCQEETQESRQAELNQTPMQRRMCSWGYKFEQFCLSKSPNEPAVTNTPVDECSEFSCVFRTKLDRHSLLYGAEMDGIQSDMPVHMGRYLSLKTLDFLELKTCLKDMNEKQMNSYLRYKIRNWWCQSFLVGIEKIIIGWRDQNGFVCDIEELKVSTLPKQAKNWCAATCANFLASFLNCLKSTMAKVDCPNTVYRFQYDAQKSLITYDIFQGFTEKTFLPEYFIEFIEDLESKSK